MTVFTAETLNEALQEILVVLSSSAYTWAVPYMTTLYNTGLRINELRLLPDWELLPNDQLLAKTLKGSNSRLISIANLHEAVYFDFLNGTDYTYNRSYDSYERAFLNASGQPAFFVEGKNIGSHMFRHSYIKQKFLGGMTIAEIKFDTGIINDATVLSYIQSQIYYE